MYYCVCVWTAKLLDSFQVVRKSALQTQRLEDADGVPAVEKGRGGRMQGKEKEEEVTGKTNEDRNRDGDGDWDYFAIATVAKSVKVKFVRQKAAGGRRSRAAVQEEEEE